MIKTFIFFCGFAVCCLSASDQLMAQDSDQRDYYNWFDAQIGVENTGLFNGIRYKELYRVKDGKHKFYKSPDYLAGNLVYDGQPYFDVQLKYDLFEDQLIVELQTGTGPSILKLIKAEVDGFTIEDKTFEHLKDAEFYKSNQQIDGFYEVLKPGTSITLYKKHRKIMKKILENKTVLYEFRSDNGYYVYYQGLFYSIAGKNDLVRILPEKKKQINDYYSGNKYLMKSDYDLFIIQITDRIDASLASKSSQS